VPLAPSYALPDDADKMSIKATGISLRRIKFTSTFSRGVFVTIRMTGPGHDVDEEVAVPSLHPCVALDDTL